MRVLVACEESQRVCCAFRERGHEAFSCDVVDPSGDHPEWHIKSDVIPLLNGNCTFETLDGVEHTQVGRWDMIIAFPPCTDLAVRRLTPKECFRLQGWSDDYFDKASLVNQDNNLYKQVGNGVTVNVIEEIAKRM